MAAYRLCFQLVLVRTRCENPFRELCAVTDLSTGSVPCDRPSLRYRHAGITILAACLWMFEGRMDLCTCIREGARYQSMATSALSIGSAYW